MEGMSQQGDEEDKIKKDLLHFHRNFSASFSISEEDVHTETAPKSTCKTKNTSFSSSGRSSKSATDVDTLKDFHKSFHLAYVSEKPVSKANGEQEEGPRPVPKSLDINHQQNGINVRKKKRRKKPNEGMTDFATVYELTNEILGKGAWSTVETCRHRKSGKEYAVKIIHKTRTDVRNRVMKEVEILYICSRNRNFLQIEDLFETNEKFYLVSEKMAGPLLALIQKKERFTEREASMVTGEVTNAIEFLHSKGIAHRDLKPENILCEKEDEVVPIKVCDFDLSSLATGQSAVSPNLFTPVGSAEFMAPEVVGTFRGEVFSYDKKCDLWSLGVVVYMMLSGSPPFYGRCGEPCGWERGEECDKCQAMLLQRISRGEYGFPTGIWDSISSEAKDLISKLLECDTEKRLSAKEVLGHPWLDREDVPETPLTTPSALRRNPSIPEELSFFAASCLKCTRKMSTHYEHRPFTLSPPGSSELASRRENKQGDDHTLLLPHS